MSEWEITTEEYPYDNWRGKPEWRWRGEAVQVVLRGQDALKLSIKGCRSRQEAITSLEHGICELTQTRDREERSREERSRETYIFNDCNCA